MPDVSRDNLLGQFDPMTLPEALARSLRDMMQVNGQPRPQDYPYDRGLYEEHRRQWDNARQVLEWYNRDHGTKNVDAPF